MRRPRWLLFDLAGTTTKSRWAGKTARIGGRYISIQELRDLDSSPLYDNYMIGLLSEDDIISDFLTKTHLEVTANDLRIFLRENHSFNPGMEQLIRELKGHCKLACLTNEGKEWLAYKVSRLGLDRYFDEIVGSYALGCLKPDKTYFEKALALIGAEAQDCIVIDDSQKNCDGAKTAGIEAIRYIDTASLREELTRHGIL